MKFLVLVLALCGTVLRAQATWNATPVLEESVRAAMAYDTVHQQVLLYTPVRGDLYSWDGASWNAFPRTGTWPTARSAAGFCFDSQRGVIVLFGGQTSSGVFLDDVWEWNGSNWLQRLKSGAWPVARRESAMAFDPRRGRAVLHGGVDFVLTPLSDVWEWDGTAWQQKQASPGIRYLHTMTYDATRNRILVFGGAPSSTLQELWEWDGAVWALQHPATPILGRYLHASAYDAFQSRLLVFGGSSGTDFLGDTWTWDGTDWSPRVVGTAPSGRRYSAATYDATRHRVVLFGGMTIDGMLSDTWEWDGAQWSCKSFSSTPQTTKGTCLVYDSSRGKPVFHGWLGNGAYMMIWSFDGRQWVSTLPPVWPTERSNPGVAYDGARRRTVMFGGFRSALYLNDLWEFDGASWTSKNLAVVPPGRANAGIVYDSARQRIVMFGGNSNITLGDHWEYDGSQWQARVLNPMPSPRTGPAMCYDSRRQRIVLFGGRATASLGDTWEFDGASWARRTTPIQPQARAGAVFVFDSARERCVLYGGNDLGNSPPDSTWEWDGGSWKELPLRPFPEKTSPNLACYDEERRTLMLLCKPSNSKIPNNWEVWNYSSPFPSALTVLGSGCPSGTGTASLFSLDRRLAWLGDNFALRMEQLPNLLPTTITLGVSSNSWMGLPLPFDLGSIAMPGCFLYASGELAIPVLSPGGVATLPLPLCQCWELGGQSLHAQGFVLDPASNPRGVAVSNGLSIRLGIR